MSGQVLIQFYQDMFDLNYAKLEIEESYYNSFILALFDNYPNYYPEAAIFSTILVMSI